MTDRLGEGLADLTRARGIRLEIRECGLRGQHVRLQLDFMATVHAVRSFAALRANATPVQLGGASLLVASLGDIIRSKKAAGRPRDRAVLDVLKRTYEEATRSGRTAGRRSSRPCGAKATARSLI